MGVWIFYILAMIPVAVGAVLWYKNRSVNWAEWLGGCALGFAMAGIFHYVAITGQTKDYETWSGQITRVVHHPYWHAEWEEWVPPTYDKKGNKTGGGYYETHTRDYPEHWTALAWYGKEQDEREIAKSTYLDIVAKFGGKTRAVLGHRPDFDHGDRNDYLTDCDTGYVIPVTLTKRFENRIKAAPTIFDFAVVPTNINVHPYPANANWFASDRLMGTALVAFDQLEFDRLNTRLGPAKKVNLIAIGFGQQDSSMADWQEAAWIGGKKNDLVLCWGGDYKKPTWTKVFGWSDSEICKRELESLMMDGVGTAQIPAIEKMIVDGYEIKEWDDFNYVTVEPPTWSYWVYILVAGLAQAGFWFWAHNNEFDKDGSRGGRSYSVVRTFNNLKLFGRP